MKTPIVLIIFNRPEQTKRVFEVIESVKPKNLLIIADGPRNKEDSGLCRETRKIVDKNIPGCDVRKNYSETNLGCRKRVSSGLDWVFSNVDRAIILEDDCLPEPSFFEFCENLLEKYEGDERIMHISGNFFQQDNPSFKSEDSYYFSNLPHIWGWATWRRSWIKYDVRMTRWPETKQQKILKKTLTNPAVYEYWETVWDDYYNEKIQSWDGQWAFSCMLNNGLCINPTVNLVSNIGFGPDARETKNPKNKMSNIATKKIAFPLVHPTEIKPSLIADSFTWKQNFGINKKIRQKILGPLRRRFPDHYTIIRNLFRKN